MTILPISDPAFASYGKVLEGYDTQDLLRTLEAATPLPEGVEYLSEVDMADDRREQDCECTVSFGMRGFFLLCIVSFRQQFVGGR